MGGEEEEEEEEEYRCPFSVCLRQLNNANRCPELACLQSAKLGHRFASVNRQGPNWVSRTCVSARPRQTRTPICVSKPETQSSTSLASDGLLTQIGVPFRCVEGSRAGQDSKGAAGTFHASPFARNCFDGHSARARSCGMALRGIPCEPARAEWPS